MAKGDRGRIAAVLAADADLEVAARRATPLGANGDQLADALAVDGDERIDLEDASLGVVGKDRRGIIARQPETGLRQVVGAEGEELRSRLALGDFGCPQGRPRQL